jgi:hypothetical protein
MNKHIVRIAFLLALPLSSGLFAQTTAGFGAISGVVTDASGSVVPGARVLVENPEKGIRRELESNGNGGFSASTLVPAAGYSVTVSKTGFANYEAKNLTLSVGQVVTLTAKLNITSAATSVDVSDAAPIVENEKTDVSQVVSSRQILDLPVNGRRVDAFVLLTPGVTSDGPFGLISFRGNPGGNAFLMDGNDTTNQFYDENAGRTRTVNIAQDAVQEFQVVSSNFLAEYGKASGGVVNTVTRSGSNTMNGTLYWFFRNRSLNATDITAQGVNPPEWRHQAGASIGGPIIKNKLFYFFNGELQRRNEPIVSSNLLTATSASGPFDAGLNLRPNGCNTAVGGVVPSAAQCAAAASYVVSRIRTQLVPRTSDINLLFGKLDYRPNDKNSISLSANYLDFRSPNGIQTALSYPDGSGIGNNADTNVFDRTARAEWTYVATPTAVNSLRYGLFIDRQLDPASLSLIPSFGPISLSVTNTGGNLAVPNGYPRLNPSETRHQIADTYSWNVGPHSLKFGFDYTHVEDYVSRLGNRYGTYSYPSFSAFALDYTGNTRGARNYNSFSQGFGNPIVDTKLKEISFFVQDQWHITPKLLFSPGLRYERTFLPQPTLSNPAWPQTAVVPQTSLNIGPRLGLAYTVNPKTVIRAGYGLFFNRYTSSTVENAFLTNGLYQASYNLNTAAQITGGGPVFPNALPSQPTGITGVSTILFLDKKWRNPYSQQATLAVEREIAKDTSLTVSYVWSLGLHLLQTRDVNAAAPTSSYTFPILNASGSQVGAYTTPLYTTRVNPAYGGVYQLESVGKSYYDGLLVQLNKRFSNSFMGNVAYTWSHSIDNNQGGGGSTLFGSTFATSVFNGDYNGEKGNSSSDQRQRLVVNGILAPVFTKRTDWFSANVINGWQLSVIELAGTPFGIAPTISTRDRPYLANGTTIGTLNTSSLNGLGGSNRVPFEDTAFLKLGNIFKTDARIQKSISVTEKVKVNLFFEAFNVFNHVLVQGSSARVAQQYTAIRQTSGALNNVTALVPNAAYGLISATSESLNGTTARRAQVGLRILF